MKSFELLRNLPMMVHSLDVQGKIVQVNNYWLEVLGYKEDEVLGRSSTDFLTDESKKFAKVILPLFFEEKSVKNIPYQFVKKSGEKVSILMSAALVEDSKGNSVSIAISTEVTDIITSEGGRSQESKQNVSTKFDMNKKLISLRRDKGVTQEKMAEVLDISLRTYQRLEHGEAHLTVTDLHKIAENFNISALKLLMSMNVYEHKGVSRILLVEDEEVLAGIFHDDLASWGFEVDVAFNGLEAIELLKLKSYDVLITDIDMPELNGYELIEWIKHSVMHDIKKVIVVSGLNEKLVKKDLLKKSISEDITIFEKPISILDLKAALLKEYLT